ncbi:MAG: hypothetical protein KDD53_05775 [Bdellovibrionales bacterium]|nr:hypothetical protein [Bdellovibrionales bacterium]
MSSATPFKCGRFGTHYRIIISFLLLAGVLIYLVQGNVDTLAGVYTISFLSVMALFALGNILLKIRRNKLPREIRASWMTVILALCAVGVGLVGNVMLDLKNVEVFFLYFIPALVVVMVMLSRTSLLSIAIYMVRSANSAIAQVNRKITKYLERSLEAINSQVMVFFTRGDNIANLNNAMLYVKNNEHTNRIKIVTVVKDKKEVPERLKSDLKFLDDAYPDISIEFVVIEDTFGPDLLKKLSQEWNIPLNFMFIGSPGDRFPHRLESLGGARLII